MRRPEHEKQDRGDEEANPAAQHHHPKPIGNDVTPTTLAGIATTAAFVGGCFLPAPALATLALIYSSWPTAILILMTGYLITFTAFCIFISYAMLNRGRYSGAKAPEPKE